MLYMREPATVEQKSRARIPSPDLEIDCCWKETAALPLDVADAAVPVFDAVEVPVDSAEETLAVAVAVRLWLQKASLYLTPLLVRQLERSPTDCSCARQYRPQSLLYDWTLATLQQWFITSE